MEYILNARKHWAFYPYNSRNLPKKQGFLVMKIHNRLPLGQMGFAVVVKGEVMSANHQSPPPFFDAIVI